MSKTFFKIGFSLLVLAGLVRPVSAAVPGMTTLTGHVPSVVSQLAPTGRLAGSTNVHLTIGLPVRNQAALTALLQQVYDPASPNYHNYLSPSEFTEQFGPTTNDYQSVINFAQTNGFTVTRTAANRMLLEVNAHASDVERAFNVTLNTYQHPTENRTFYASSAEPSVPSALPIIDAWGLNNYVRPHTKLRYSSTNLTVSPKVGAGPGGNFIGNDFRAAYVPGTTLNGAGQKVALVQFDGYYASDIAAYATLAGLPSVSLTNILLGGFSGAPTLTGGEVEVSLDIEMVISMAPGVNQILVYEGDPFFNFNPNSVLNQIAVDNAARQISCSWGWTGGPNATSDQIFQQMALQGQTFYNASGDSDAFLPGQVDNPGYTGFPSSNPYITEVGGTTLSTSGPGGSRTGEQVWNWGGGTGSSGGISSFYAIPSWQQNVPMGVNHGSTTFRNIPDVALTGDNVYVIADGGIGYLGVGGTSCAAPLWAGFTALINQQGTINGKPSVGFINPAIYAIAKTAAYATTFNDITNGDNTWFQSPTNFFAVTNYDLCTGLGTPNGTNLINALVGTSVTVVTGPVISAPRSPWGTTMGAFNGSNPNGSWYLFIQDDKQLDTGIINNGWSLNLTSANPVGFASDNQMFSAPDVANVNLNSTWTVSSSVTNYGPSASANVVVTDVMPVGAGLNYASSAATQGSIVRFGSSLVWSVGNLAANTGATMSVTFGANLVGTYTNVASVSSITTDPNPDDDVTYAVANVAVFTPPAIARVTFGSGSPTITVTNASGAVNTTIQATTNLVAPIVWQSVFVTNSAAFNFTDLAATNYPVRFYRAILGP